MPSISTCLIESNAFFRLGLKHILSVDSDFDIDGAYPDFLAAEKMLENKESIELVVIGTDEDSEGIVSVVNAAKTIFYKSRIAVLTMRTDPQCVTSSFAAGVDGYLLRDISPPALIGSLNIIMAGEKVCPAALLNIFVSREERNEDANLKTIKYHLSLRELQILEYLAIGETNKQIARGMDIAEATVKVHIKSVLRKLDLSNRTQAAVWAVNKGLTNTATGCH